MLTYHVGTYTPLVGPLERATAPWLWLGVPLFFLLSGFLLFRPFAHAIIHGLPQPSLHRYGKARFLRIAPAYWLVLTFTIIEESRALRPPRGIDDPRLLPTAAAAIALLLWARAFWRRTTLVLPAAASLAAVALLIMHPHRVWPGIANYALVYLPFRIDGVVGPAWTLCIEVSFYATLPVFAVCAQRIGRRGRSSDERALLLAALVLPAFPIGYLYLGHAGTDRNQLPIWLPGYVDEFAIGMLLAIAIEVWPQVSARTSRLLLLASFGVGYAGDRLYSLGAGSPFARDSGVLFARLMELAFALALASVLMRDEKTLLGRVLASRMLVAAGTISYGIYLWHTIVIQRLLFTPLWLDEWAGLALTLPITIALAVGSWFAIERPALALKDKRLHWRREPVAAAMPMAGTGDLIA